MAVLRLFWSEVVSCSQYLFVVLLGEVAVFIVVTTQGQAEVEDFDCSPLIKHQVGWFDITVDQTLLMGVLQPESRLLDVFECLLDWQRPALFDLLVKVSALDKVEDDVVEVALMIKVGGPGDVGVVESK